MLNLGRFPAPPASEAGFVRADPKTLVAQESDFPANTALEPVSGAPITGTFPEGSGKAPVDAYSVAFIAQNLTSIVALYGSVADARNAFASIKVPPSRHAFDFNSYGGLKVGDEQKAFSWDRTQSMVEVDLYWRSGNVIALLLIYQTTNKNYPTLNDVADSLDNYAAFTFVLVAPRVQTRIRLASHT